MVYISRIHFNIIHLDGWFQPLNEGRHAKKIISQEFLLKM